MEDVIDGNTITATYYSLDEFADAAVRRIELNGLRDAPGSAFESHHDGEWRGGTFEDAVKLAKTGWEEHLTETLDIVESAVDMVEKEHDVQTFTPVWDVTGSEVDVARYLSGEPENMIDFPPIETSKLGKVITLCAGMSISASVDPESYIRRGQVIAAFAMILARMGHACELWMDGTDTGRSSEKLTTSVKVLVKGTNDTLDPARILFAYAHVGMNRSLKFATQHGLPSKFRKAIGVPGYYGMPCNPLRNLPEGTIYLPGIRSSHDIPDIHEQLKGLLRTAGLLREDETR